MAGRRCPAGGALPEPQSEGLTGRRRLSERRAETSPARAAPPQRPAAGLTVTGLVHTYYRERLPVPWAQFVLTPGAGAHWQVDIQVIRALCRASVSAGESHHDDNQWSRR